MSTITTTTTIAIKKLNPLACNKALCMKEHQIRELSRTKNKFNQKTHDKANDQKFKMEKPSANAAF